MCKYKVYLQNYPPVVVEAASYKYDSNIDFYNTRGELVDAFAKYIVWRVEKLND